MSIKIMDWVFENSKAQGIERLILLVIADHCNIDGENAFPRVSVIARRANVSERTVRRRIADLVLLGELEVIQREGSSNLYKIVIPGLDSGPEYPEQAQEKPKSENKKRASNKWHHVVESLAM